MFHGVILLVALVAATGCTRRFVAEAAGDYGWGRVDANGPPAEDQTALNRLTPLPPDPSCEAIQRGVDSKSTAPILVFVHGIGAGTGPEWDNAMSVLMRAGPAAAFLFKWVAYENRDLMVERLADGVNRIAQCTPRKIIVLAHSAGGVLSAYATRFFVVPPGAEVEVVTVASPLAGAMARASDGESQLMYFFDLGSRINSYPAGAKGVRVWHLRTRFPADTVMEPRGDGRAANDITVGVPGAFQYTLPEQLSHVASLSWVARKMAREGWVDWLVNAKPSPPEFVLDR